MPVEWLSVVIRDVAAALGTDDLVLKPVLAILLVCGLCGMLGSMVVGNRMAFFSDAMAHCAFAGVSLGFLRLLAGYVIAPSRASRPMSQPLARCAPSPLCGGGLGWGEYLPPGDGSKPGPPA